MALKEIVTIEYMVKFWLLLCVVSILGVLPYFQQALDCVGLCMSFSCWHDNTNLFFKFTLIVWINTYCFLIEQSNKTRIWEMLIDQI